MWQNDICLGYIKWLKFFGSNERIFDHSSLRRSGDSMLDSKFNQVFHENIDMGHASLHPFHYYVSDCD